MVSHELHNKYVLFGGECLYLSVAQVSSFDYLNVLSPGSDLLNLSVSKRDFLRSFSVIMDLSPFSL